MGHFYVEILDAVYVSRLFVLFDSKIIFLTVTIARANIVFVLHNARIRMLFYVLLACFDSFA